MANFRKTPDESSIKAFIDAISGHNKVATVERRPNSYLVDIQLNGGTKLIVFMTNIYVVGEADVREILGKHRDVNVVVTLSSWNMVSGDAVQYGREREIGVFKWKDFFGAVNYRKFWLYEDIPLGIDADKLTAERRRRQRDWN
jgi:hypothetical protein